jgi:hypothetical protein
VKVGFPQVKNLSYHDARGDLPYGTLQAETMLRLWLRHGEQVQDDVREPSAFSVRHFPALNSFIIK